MRKKLIVILFAIIASVCVVLGMSACGENGGNKGQTDSDTDILQSDGTLLYELSSDGTYYIVYDVSSRDVTDIVIPATYNSLPVASIREYAFAKCTLLESITIPDSITNIGYAAFTDCSSLTSIVIPNGVSSIRESTFSGCTSLESIVIPDSVSSIQSRAFDDCTNITTATMPLYALNYMSENDLQTVIITSGDSISSDTFRWFPSLKNLTITGSVASISEDAFREYTLLENVLISGSVTSIGSGAFSLCSSLKNVTITGNVSSIGRGAFSDCTSLKNLTVGENVTSIGEVAFWNCDALEGVYITNLDAWYKIDFGGFSSNPLEYAGNLYLDGKLVTELTIPVSLTDIKDYTFAGCSSLTNVTIPNNVINIGDFAFSSCSSITNIIIPDSVTDIGDSSFSGCTSINSITVPDSVTSLGRYVFLGCTNIATATIPAHVIDDVPKDSLKTVIITSGESIERNAFANCNSLESITIPDSVTDINDAAFSGCTSLANVYITDLAAWCQIKFSSYSYTNPLCYAENFYLNGELVLDLVIPKGITSINSYAFDGYASLKSLTIPDSVNSIGSNAFRGCVNIIEARMPALAIDKIPQDSLHIVTITGGEIGKEAFKDCASLESIQVGDGVTFMDKSAFANCNSLESVHIADMAAWCNIGFYDYASNPLYYANKLYLNGELVTELVVPEGVTSLNRYVFSGCNSFVSITIPDSVTSIDSSAFYGCSNITSATMPSLAIGYIPQNNLQTVVITSGDYISDKAFYNCASLKSITISDSITSIGKDAFSGCNAELFNSYGNMYYLGNEANPYMVLVSVIPNSESIIIHDDMKLVCPEAFDDCIIKDVTMPAKAIEYVPQGNLEQVTITKGVIEEYAFEYCRSIKKLTLGDGVTSVEACAFLTYAAYDDFNSNPPLFDLTLSKSVEKIDEYAFTVRVSDGNNVYVNRLKNIHFEGNLSDWLKIDGLENLIYSSRIQGGKVCKAANVLFNGNELEGELVIPEGVTNIQAHAFDCFDKITEVVIPDTVKTIGEYAFYGCTSLANIAIGNSMTSVGENAFEKCDSLASICFEDITSWCGIDGTNNIDNSKVYIGDRKLYEITNIVIPDGVTSIGRKAFFGCSSLTSITIPDSVTSIGSYAFSGCSNLTSMVIPDSVTSIGYSAFSDCSSLESITIPFVGTTLNGTEDTHFGCIFGAPSYSNNSDYVPASLKDVILTGGDSIGDYAFEDCSSLTSMVIPDSVTSIGTRAFYGCNNLEGVYITDITMWCAIDFYDYYSNPLYYAGNLYLDGELVTELVIPDGVTSIDDSAFSGGGSFTSIVIPDSVTSIGNSAFYNCSSLTNMVIPDSVTSIGSSAFRGCSSLTNIVIPDGVTSIGDYVFYNCSSLTNMVIPDGVTSIGNSAFYNCCSLEGIYITDIAAWCAIDFYDYYSNPLYYAGNLYIDGELVTELVIPNSVMGISDYAFYGCSSLTSINIPDGVTSIGYSAFSECRNLISIVVPNSVTSIGNSAFYNCNSLTSIVIPDSVMSIYYSAFYGCTSLEVIYYYGTESDWAKISIGNNNDDLTAATRYHYSETQPTEDGNFWHYAEDGVTPVIWTKETDES